MVLKRTESSARIWIPENDDLRWLKEAHAGLVFFGKGDAIFEAFQSAVIHLFNVRCACRVEDHGVLVLVRMHYVCATVGG